MYDYEADEAKQNQNPPPPPARHSYGSCGSCEELWLRLQRLLRLLCVPITKLIIIKQGATPRQRFEVGVMPPNTITICYTYTAQKVSPSPESKNAKESPALWLYKSGIRYLVAGIINLTREMPGKLAHKSDGLKSIG